MPIPDLPTSAAWRRERDAQGLIRADIADLLEKAHEAYDRRGLAAAAPALEKLEDALEDLRKAAEDAEKKAKKDKKTDDARKYDAVAKLAAQQRAAIQRIQRPLADLPHRKSAFKREWGEVYPRLQALAAGLREEEAPRPPSRDVQRLARELAEATALHRAVLELDRSPEALDPEFDRELALLPEILEDLERELEEGAARRVALAAEKLAESLARAERNLPRGY